MSDNQNSLSGVGRNDHSINRNEAGSLPTNLEIEASRIAGTHAGNRPVIKLKSKSRKVQGIDSNNQPVVVPGEMLEDAKFTQT